MDKNIITHPDIINQMKSGFTEADFKTLVVELAKRFQDQPCDQVLVQEIVYRGRSGK